MSRRSRSFNAFEQATTAAIDDAVTSIPLDSVTNLTPPGYLVIDPDNPLLREYIFYTEINALVLDNVSRGLEGSAAGVAQEHSSGARVRAVSVHQWLNDIFDDIEDLENGPATGTTIPGYLLTAGGNAMGADLDMGGGGFRVIDMGNGLSDQDAATVKQVTDGDDVVRGDFAAADLLLLDLLGTRPMEGSIDMGTFQVRNMINPTLDQDAATKLYTDDADDLKLNLTGGTLTGVLTIDGGTRATTIGSSGSEIRIGQGSSGNATLDLHGDDTGSAGTRTGRLISSTTSTILAALSGGAATTSYELQNSEHTWKLGTGTRLRLQTALMYVDTAVTDVRFQGVNSFPTSVVNANLECRIGTQEGRLRLTTSSEAVKHNWTDIDDAAEIIDALNPGRFQSLAEGDDQDRWYAGFGKESVARVFPAADNDTQYDVRAIVAALVADNQDMHRRLEAAGV